MQTDKANRFSIDRRDILAAGLAAILVINLIFTLGYILGLYPKYENQFDWGLYEYSNYFIIWGMSCIVSIVYSVLWAYITQPLNRWAVFALLFSAITFAIFAYNPLNYYL